MNWTKTVFDLTFTSGEYRIQEKMPYPGINERCFRVFHKTTLIGETYGLANAKRVAEKHQAEGSMSEQVERWRKGGLVDKN